MLQVYAIVTLGNEVIKKKRWWGGGDRDWEKGNKR